MCNRAFILSRDDVEWSQLSQPLDCKHWATSIIFHNTGPMLHSQSSPRKALRFHQLAANLLEQFTPSDEFNIMSHRNWKGLHPIAIHRSVKF